MISSSSPSLTSLPGKTGPDGAELVVVGVVDERARRGLGQAVALEDHDAGGAEPLGDVAVERRGAGDEEADAAAEAVADLGEDQLVEEAVLHLEADRHRLALALAALDLEADLEGLLEDLLLRAALGGLHGDDAAVGLLEDARGGTHERRLHHAQVVDDLLDAAVDRRGEAAGHLGGHQHLAERVGHRQPAELEVVAGRGCPARGSPRPRRPTRSGAAARPWGGRWCRRCR